MTASPSSLEYAGHQTGIRFSGSATICELGRHYTRSAAKYPHYSDIELRYRSFREWPSDKAQKPFNLAVAGFYFAGVDDCTRCFHCGIGLKNWLPGDLPFVEHARWSAQCEFIRDRKGDEFVDNIQLNFPREYPEEEPDVDIAPDTTDYSDIVRRVLERPCGVSIKEMFSEAIAVSAVTKVLGAHGWEENAVTISELADVAINLQESQENGESENLEPVAQAQVLESSQNPSDDSSEGEDVPDILGAAVGEDSVQSSLDPDAQSLLAENRRLKSQLLCKKCRSKEVSAVVLPCGHFVYCSDCAASLSVCILCRQKVATSLKVYV